MFSNRKGGISCCTVIWTWLGEGSHNHVARSCEEWSAITIGYVWKTEQWKWGLVFLLLETLAFKFLPQNCFRIMLISLDQIYNIITLFTIATLSYIVLVPISFCYHFPSCLYSFNSSLFFFVSNRSSMSYSLKLKLINMNLIAFYFSDAAGAADQNIWTLWHTWWVELARSHKNAMV